eukprot:gene2632-2933_t
MEELVATLRAQLEAKENAERAAKSELEGYTVSKSRELWLMREKFDKEVKQYQAVKQLLASWCLEQASCNSWLSSLQSENPQQQQNYLYCSGSSSMDMGSFQAADAQQEDCINVAAAARLFSGATTQLQAPHLSWYYLDGSRVRGPHDPALMIRWYCNCFIEQQLPVAAVLQQPLDSSSPPPLTAFVSLRELLAQDLGKLPVRAAASSFPGIGAVVATYGGGWPVYKRGGNYMGSGSYNSYTNGGGKYTGGGSSYGGWNPPGYCESAAKHASCT